ncbi:6-hydroxymethylpterin diphosphokinase MptE-like protein [uncultured Paraglaciecola sp.]|uniref:motility associated factor glycosyltransferase family protein n=1 Tax=uncultured Paraglaciecola sp. TaxID=1765024 RepID=UPI0030D7AC21|tara:strand:+ start:62003 stop:65512 length:3510 start_codon:yes stop_codon:yes gene_type:complete
MLKNIRLHLSKDEQEQALLDEKLAAHILTTHNGNINTFQRNIPSLLPYVQNVDLANYSIFINKYAENNIVDYGMGRTFYGFHPEAEVLEQIDRVEQHCPHVVLQAPLSSHGEHASHIKRIEDLESVKLRNQQQPMPYEIECLVVLGCGLGIHLSHLLKQHKIKNLLIYEPELQYFQCSVMATSWQDIFTLAKQHDTAIFLQLEKDGRDLIQDINELVQHCGITHFHLYKHYNHEVFDSLYKDLTERSWNDIADGGFKISSQESYLDFVPNWTPNIDLDRQTLLTSPNKMLSNNLSAFKKYFPDIYKEYKDYTPQKWLPISNSTGEVNLVKIDSLQSWYGESPKQDCTQNFDNFNEQPNKDGLVLGYKGTKLAHYIHYQFVKETEELLKEAEEEVGALPNNVPSIIMFGLGVGYQLEKLLEEHTVEKLFICEPNPDFFYASLFAIDWQKLFETVENSETRIYLNIGDDGSNLFRDLLSQFYAIGPYLLNSTYFYQSYYNASLNSAISQLREQLQVVISMGEYFDHAYYGIAHTKEGMRRKIPILTANPASKLSYDDKEVPIFIVGNGPSLDSSIDAIKEWQGQAIVVSCGTTLQALHRHGITPDFHAEIEQNRSTFDWAVLIGDLDYLKKITLISCNGIHPDTCDLYKDVLIAFKEGESSTVSALSVLGRQNFEVLQNSFPTVSNFVCDLFSTIGFTSIYLIGVDLGFVDVKHHHSKLSGYYQQDGQETYDYTDSANTSLIVPGNFRPKVNTKHEFKVSRQIIEQVTSGKPKDQAFYNCSDGAKIQGTLPLRPDELLIMASKPQQAKALDKLKTVIFSNKDLGHYIQRFNQIFSQQVLMEELKAFEILLKNKVRHKDELEKIINKQKEMLFSSYKNGNSLLFYYLYGTVNYTNAVFVKLGLNTELLKPDSTVHKCIDLWALKINEISNILIDDNVNFDLSHFNLRKREKALLAKHSDKNSILVISNSDNFKKSLKLTLANKFGFKGDVTFSNRLDSNEEKSFDHVIVYQDKTNESPFFQFQQRGTHSTIFMLKSGNISDSILVPKGVTYCPIPFDETDTIVIDYFLATHAILFTLSEHSCPLILLKYNTKNPAQFGQQTIDNLAGINSYVDFSSHIACFKNPATQNLVSKAGTRGKLINRALVWNDLINKVISDQEFVKIVKNNTFNDNE